MGTPVKIVDLAHRVIERAGLRPGADVSVVFSGTRPGEKLSEELTSGKETAKTTAIPGIWVVESQDVVQRELVEALDQLEMHASEGDDQSVLRLMQKILPEYRPMHPVRRSLVPVDGRQTALSS